MAAKARILQFAAYVGETRPSFNRGSAMVTHSLT